MKRFLCAGLLVPLCALAIACQDKATLAELETFKSRAAIEEQNGALVKSVFDRLSRRDEAVYQELYAPEYGWHSPRTTPRR